MAEADYLGYFLADAIIALKAEKRSFSVKYTVPPDCGFFQVDTSKLFVVRQRLLACGTLELTAAAKMRKEVCKNGI